MRTGESDESQIVAFENPAYQDSHISIDETPNPVPNTAAYEDDPEEDSGGSVVAHDLFGTFHRDFRNSGQLRVISENDACVE
jgi:hypothetical protein